MDALIPGRYFLKVETMTFLVLVIKLNIPVSSH